MAVMGVVAAPRMAMGLDVLRLNACVCVCWGCAMSKFVDLCVETNCPLWGGGGERRPVRWRKARFSSLDGRVGGNTADPAEAR